MSQILNVKSDSDLTQSIAPLPTCLSEEQSIVVENLVVFGSNALNQLDELSRSEATEKAKMVEENLMTRLRGFVREFQPTTGLMDIKVFLEQVEVSPLQGDKLAFIVRTLDELGFPAHMIRSVARFMKKGKVAEAVTLKRKLEERRRRGIVEPTHVTDDTWRPKLTEADARYIDSLPDKKTVKRDPAQKIVRSMPRAEIEFLAKLKAGKRRPAATAWRVPFKASFEVVARPKGYCSMAHFKAWANYECSQLALTLTGPDQFVTGNYAAELLWYAQSFKGRVKDYGTLIGQAKFYTDSYKAEFPEPPRRYLTPGGIVVHGRTCITPQELETMSGWFKGNFAIYRYAQRYLAEYAKSAIPNPSVRAHIQSVVDKKINNTEPVVYLSTPEWNMKVYQGPRPEPRYAMALQSKLNPSAKAWFPAHDKTVPEWAPGSYVYQGQGASMPFRVQHEVTLPEPENVVQAVEALVGETAFQSMSKHGRVVAQFGAFYGQLMKARDVSDIVLALTAFVSGNDVAWGYVTNLIRKVSTASYQGNETKVEGYFANMSIGEFLRGLGSSLWDAIVGAGLFVLVEGAMSELKSYLVAPLQDLIASARISLFREAGKSVATYLLECITEILNRIKRCWQTKSFAPLWGDKWDPAAWCRHVDGIIHNYNSVTNTNATTSSLKALESLREAGTIPGWITHPMNLIEYCEMGTEFLDQGRQLLRYFQKDVVLTREITIRASALRNFLTPLKTQAAVAGIRPMPFYLFMFGDPGAGKTMFQKLLALGLSRKHKFTEPSLGTHSLALNENFQTGLNHHKWCVVGDDIDHSVAPPAAGVMNHIELICKLVNNELFRVEESESSLKGQSFASPEIFFQQSNFPDSHVSEYTKVPGAWWRRIAMYVNLKAKAAYGEAGVLDPVLAEASDTYDMYDIEVRYVDYSQLAVLKTNSKHIPLTDPKTYSFPDFLELFYEKFDAHREREFTKLKRFSKTDGVCTVCHMTMDRDCGHWDPLPFAEYQGCRDTCGVFRDWALARSVSAYVWYTGLKLEDMVARHFNQEFWVKTAAAAAAAGALAIMIKQFALQGREANSVDGLIPFNWFRAEQKFTPGIPPAIFSTTYSYQDLIKNCLEAFVEVDGTESGGMKAYGAIVAHNLVVFPTHLCPGDGKVKISWRGKTVEATVDEFTRRPLQNRELCELRCGNLPGTGGLRSFMLQAIDEQISMYDELVILGPTTEYRPSQNRVISLNAGRSIQTDAATKSGDCGYLYLGRLGQSWRVVAMHFMADKERVTGQIRSYGAKFSAQECERVAASLGTTFQGVSTPPLLISKKGLNSCTYYPPKSEVWAAVSVHGAEVYPFGTLENPITGMTLKTKLRDSLSRPFLEEFEEEWCGEKGYWRMPQFRGKMEDEKWTSPYTAAFETQNKGSFDASVMWMAMADYLSGLMRVDPHGYAELSEEQAITGVPGSFVHSVNMRTSVGPPYNVKKSLHIAPDPGNSHMSPEMWAMYDDYMGALGADFIPAVLGLCILKDEALKPGKIPRVFTVYSAAVNLALKKKGLFKSVMRANPSVFESAVGINMTGADAQKIVQSLQLMCPDLDILYEADARRLDKSFDGEWWDYVALVIYAISWIIGVDPRGNYSMILGCKHTRFCIKNDLFECFWNGSGSDATVEINGIVMSLGERYVFYKHKTIDKAFVLRYMAGFFENPLPQTYAIGVTLSQFQMYFVLWTYGDDQLMAARIPLPPDFEEIWLVELGIEMTDASKEGKMRQKTISEVQFLKRKFRYDAEFGRYVTPLDKKTMARMLVIKNDSSLSAPDGAAIGMTECLREAVYHGREFYERLRPKFLDVSMRLGLTRNAYLQLPEFDHYKEKILAGTFQTWVDRAELLQFDFEND